MIKKIICTILLFLVIAPCTLAKEKVKARASVQSDFILKENTKDIVFITYKDIKIDENTLIPSNSVIYAENIQAQRERRWHKSGYIVCKLMKYSLSQFDDETIDISDKDIYFVARKYEKVYKKEASIIATEIILSQGASFFAPGVDILYFFTKGAIQREKNPNWFKAGVSNAYENSICWFWLKGKEINLSQGNEIDLKKIEKDRAEKLTSQISKRKFKEDMRALKKELNHEFKIVKKSELKEIKKLKKEIKEEEKFAKHQQGKETISEDEFVETDIKDIQDTKDFKAAAKIKK